MKNNNNSATLNPVINFFNTLILDKLLKGQRRNIPLIITSVLFIVLFGIGSVLYNGFFSFQVLFNLLIDNAHLLVTAVGMTFVIISGGIDLSVGSVLAFTTVLSAHLVERAGVSPLLVIPLVLSIGTLFGGFMGTIIHFFKLPPFIITLAGMYLARGMAFVISLESISMKSPIYAEIASYKFVFPGNSFISINVIICLLVLLLAFYVARYKKFGRTIYALGGSEQSAVLMGLPVSRSKILVYALSGFCSALAGVVFTFYMQSGYSLHGNGLELDAIAAVVIGGTLLSGGVGNVFGTMFGVLVLGTIQSLINFEGTLSSWWTKIVIGVLIFIFCLIQKLFEKNK
jgi:simple sugar transport system permease protein